MKIILGDFHLNVLNLWIDHFIYSFYGLNFFVFFEATMSRGSVRNSKAFFTGEILLGDDSGDSNCWDGQSSLFMS